MGRKTFDSIVSIVGGPLPDRPNIVVTRNSGYEYKGVEVTNSLDRALDIASSYCSDEIHIGGGEEIYRLIMPRVDRIYATYFEDDVAGDTFFPEFEDEFEVVQRHDKREYKGVFYQWVDYVRKY